jgi:hypothetical protein
MKWYSVVIPNCQRASSSDVIRTLPSSTGWSISERARASRNRRASSWARKLPRATAMNTGSPHVSQNKGDRRSAGTPS